MSKPVKPLSTKIRFFYYSLFQNCLLLLIPILIIGPFSIFRSVKDNTAAIEKNMTLTLEQLDSVSSSLFSHIDNANIFFSSNPRVTIQLQQAFNESALNLEYSRNISNLSLYFKNLLYTDSYIGNIYVYYNNPYHRIFYPQRGALQTVSTEEEAGLLKLRKEHPNQDTWLLTNSKKLTYTDMPIQTLYVFRKLYARSSSSSNGILIFAFDLSKLKKYFGSMMQYQNQIYCIYDSNGHLICSNSSSDELTQNIGDVLPFPNTTGILESVTLNSTPYQLYQLHSQRQEGFTYVNLIPADEIYRTTENLSIIYIFLTCCAIFIAFLLAFLKTNREYQYLNEMIDLFDDPSSSPAHLNRKNRNAYNPFEYILSNLIHLFLEQDYMKMQASEKESKMQILRLRALQYQINPHFIYNTLNSIYWEAIRMTSSENTCSSMVSNLSSLMRYSIGSSQEDSKISDEINYVKTYLDIMIHRYPNQFQVIYRIDRACSIYPVMRMVLQPLVENSIYHGIIEKNSPGVICIGASMLRHSIGIYIYDNGNGIPADAKKLLLQRLEEKDINSSDHVGLANTNSRLVYAYGKNARLRFKTVEHSFTIVYFFLPIPAD